jgi:two-component system, NarL family, sensor histidine kinase EvgS
LYLDKERISQAILSLMLNSLKYTFEGFIRIKASYENQILMISITDSGIGIPKENRNKVFSIFGKLGS